MKGLGKRIFLCRVFYCDWLDAAGRQVSRISFFCAADICPDSGRRIARRSDISADYRHAAKAAYFNCKPKTLTKQKRR
jgi:hypothetical protein